MTSHIYYLSSNQLCTQNRNKREKEPIIYDGDLMDEEGVLDFLTSLEAMDLPDRIEEVNAKILAKIIEETDYVAVLFCKYQFNCPNGHLNAFNIIFYVNSLAISHISTIGSSEQSFFFLL